MPNWRRKPWVTPKSTATDINEIASSSDRSIATDAACADRLDRTIGGEDGGKTTGLGHFSSPTAIRKPER
jgi:hypothetical protein